MTDSAQEFFDLIVDPALLEFRAAEAELAQASIASDPLRLDQARANAMRRARTAAIELHQFADRVGTAATLGTSPDNLRITRLAYENPLPQATR